MDEEKYLLSALGWQQKTRPAGTRLGEQIVSYLKQQGRTFEKNSTLTDAWQRLIPEALRPYCRLDRRSGNTLFVQAQPGPYMHQVQMLSGQLLEQINRQVPRAGLQAIRVIPMKKE